MLQRQDFFGYDETNIYLDNAASTLALRRSKEAADDFLLHYGSIHRGAGFNSERSSNLYEDARQCILSSIHGTKDDVAIFTANTTDSVNKLSLIFEPKTKNGKILVSDIEHSANYLPWMKRFPVVEMPTENFHIQPYILEKYLKEDSDISLVAIAAASNITGYVTDVKSIYEICQRYDVPLFIDASQYAPHFVPDLRYCDMLAYCGHKMYAPFGVGLLAGRKKFLKHYAHSFTGGGNVVYVDEDGTPIYKDLPYSHESGTPNGIGAIAFAESHKVLYQEIGEKELFAHTKKMNHAIAKHIVPLWDFGYDVFFAENPSDEPKTPIFLLRNKRNTNQETVRLLNTPIADYEKNVFVREGAFCAYRAMERLLPFIQPLCPNKKRLSEDFSLIRFSVGLLNDERDIAYVAGKLKEINRQTTHK